MSAQQERPNPQGNRRQRTDSVGDDWVEFFAMHDAPANYKEKRETMHAFAEEHFKNKTNVVLITVSIMTKQWHVSICFVQVKRLSAITSK